MADREKGINCPGNAQNCSRGWGSREGRDREGREAQTDRPTDHMEKGGPVPLTVTTKTDPFGI